MNASPLCYGEALCFESLFQIRRCRSILNNKSLPRCVLELFIRDQLIVEDRTEEFFREINRA